MTHSRRTFLSGLGRLGNTGPPTAAPDAAEAIRSPDRRSLITFTRDAMGGEFEVDLNAGQYPQGAAAALDALDEVSRLESSLSVFRANSRIAYINAVAAFEPVPLDEELYELIACCLEWSRATGGAVDATATPLWRLWGFAKRDGRVPNATEIDAARECVGDRHVLLDPAERTVRFTKPDVELSFGFIGKGFALDRASRKLRDAGIDDYLMHGGLSSILARGTQVETASSDPVKDSGWRIGIAHPMRSSGRLEELRLRDAAIGTSGSRHQFFRHGGRKYGHILDPRTGRPAEGVISVTVIAPDATTAEALSTAFFVQGPEWTESFCATRNDVQAVLVAASDRGAGFDILRFPTDR